MPLISANTDQTLRQYQSRPGVQRTPSKLLDRTLRSLAHVTGDTMWDVGSGSGAIAIEWQLSRPGSRVYAIERFEQRCFDIYSNAQAHGAELLIVNQLAEAPILDQLPEPTMIWLGCPGESEENLCPLLWSYLSPGGWIASNAVSAIGVSRLQDARKKYGGTLTTFDVFDLPRMQWIAQKT